MRDIRHEVFGTPARTVEFGDDAFVGYTVRFTLVDDAQTQDVKDNRADDVYRKLADHQRVRRNAGARQDQPDMVAEHEHIEPQADMQNAPLVRLGKHGELERRENGKIEERGRMHPLE